MNNLPLLNDLRVFMLVARRVVLPPWRKNWAFLRRSSASARLAGANAKRGVVTPHHPPRHITEEGERIYEWAQRILQDVVR